MKTFKFLNCLLSSHIRLDCLKIRGLTVLQVVKNHERWIMDLHPRLFQRILHGSRSGWAARWRTRWTWAPGMGRGSLDRAGPRFPQRLRPSWRAGWWWRSALKHTFTLSCSVWSNAPLCSSSPGIRIQCSEWLCKKPSPSIILMDMSDSVNRRICGTEHTANWGAQLQ